MLRSIQFPMKLLSENEYRRMHPKVRARKVKAQRGEVRMFLRQLPPTRRVLDGGAHNIFAVKIVRLAQGPGLDRTNLYGACKAVEDEVAEWVGMDDRDPRFHCSCRQQRIRVRAGHPGFHVRIEVNCFEPGGSVVKVLGEAPAELGEEAEQNPPPLGKRRAKRPLPSRIQPRLPVRTAWKQVPWEAEEIEELPEYAGVDAPPATIRVPIPSTWRPSTLRGFCVEPGEAPTLTLFRTEYTHPEAGLIWLFTPWKAGAPMQLTATR